MIELGVDFFVSSVLIEAEIWNRNLNKFSSLNMVFDTGASITTIDTATIRRSGYNLKGVEEVSVAGIGSGKTLAKKIILNSLRLGGFDLGPVLIYAVDFPEEINTPALLGMNIIKEFKVTADFQDRRSDGRDATIYLNPAFDINNRPSFEQFIPSSSRFGVWAIG